MENVDPIATGLLVLSIAFGIALVVIFNLAAKLSKQRDEHTHSITELQQNLNTLQVNIQNKAQELYQAWVLRESDLIRANEREIASREASTRLEQWRYESEIAIRNDAIQRSHSVILGKVTEHLVPYMPDFPFNPKDVRFVGSPIDLVVFDGMDKDNLRQVVFVEVKTGASAALTKRERRIRDVISTGHVKWMEMRIPRQTELGISVPARASSDELDAEITQAEAQVRELERQILNIAIEFVLALQDTFERNRNIGDFVFKQLRVFRGTGEIELLIQQAESAWNEGNDEMALQMLRKAIEADRSLVPFIQDLLIDEE